MTDSQEWLVPVGAIALRILWPCAEPRSNRTLSKLTVQRCQCNIPANRVLPCERSSQLDSIVTTEAVIPCQGFRTRHERLRYRNSREVRPLSRKSALSLPATVIVKNTEAHSARECSSNFSTTDERCRKGLSSCRERGHLSGTRFRHVALDERTRV